MTESERFLKIGEYMASGLFEEPERSLFYRRALGFRRYFEHYVLPDYDGSPLYPTGKLDRTTGICPDFMMGSVASEAFKQREPELAALHKRDFEKYASRIPLVHSVSGRMAEHSLPHYERVIAEGFVSYGERIKKIKNTEMRDGLLHILKGIECFHSRCLDLLRNANADEKLISALEQVPMHPARDVYEAIVCWNFVMYLDGCDNLGCVAESLKPYWKGEDIVPYLSALYDNLDINNGYSLALHPPYDELTIQCLEASKGKRRPMIELFVDGTTPDYVWEKAFEVVRTAGGQPAFYSERGFVDGLLERLPELKPEDMKLLCGVGCTEMSISGYSNIGSVDAGINLLYVLEHTLHEKLPVCECFEEFYNALMDDIRETVDSVTDEICVSQLERAEYSPLPMRTLLMDDCIDNEKDFNAGGTRFMWSLVALAGVVNVIESLLVIRDYVFETGKYTGRQVSDLLKKNDENFLRQCRLHTPAYGADDDEANELAKKFSTEVFAMFDDKKPALGTAYLPCSIMFRSAAVRGADVGATPDGRSCGAPLADSLAAIHGKDVNGPTALLSSVTSLNLERALGTPVVNLCIDPKISDSNLKALISAYIEMGGLQLQISCADRETLIDAYHNPEAHRNLVVRVGGYSDYFNNLTDELKKMIIGRTVHS